ncbi:MAG: KilA-N domain-containing protein [Desulfuromonadales bacterium]
MSALQIVKSDFQGNEITFNNDGWFDATSAAAKFGKRPVDWLNLSSTKEYIDALLELDRSEEISLLNRNQKNRFLKVQRGGKGKTDSTWLHPKLAVAFARWLDIKFAVWCDKQIDSIIRGTLNQKRARHEASSSFKVMTSILQFVREEQGKVTACHHYSNEALLINWALSGKRQSIDRDALTFGELNLLAKLEEKNSVLIGRGVEYKTRKGIIEQYAIDLRSDRMLMAA